MVKIKATTTTTITTSSSIKQSEYLLENIHISATAWLQNMMKRIDNIDYLYHMLLETLYKILK